MIDPAALAGFAAVTALTSLLPGPNMLFVLGQAAWQKARGGLLALAGMQLGNSFVTTDLAHSALLGMCHVHSISIVRRIPANGAEQDEFVKRRGTEPMRSRLTQEAGRAGATLAPTRVRAPSTR